MLRRALSNHEWNQLIRASLVLLCQITCSEQTKIPPTLRQAQGERNFSLLNRVFDNLTK
jgi:hypothetical protein